MRTGSDHPPRLLHLRLQQVAMSGGNVLAGLMDAVRVCSLGQVADASVDVVGQCGRNVTDGVAPTTRTLAAGPCSAAALAQR